MPNAGDDFAHMLRALDRSVDRGLVSETAIARQGRALDRALDTVEDEPEPTPEEIEAAATRLLAKEENDRAVAERIRDAVERGEISEAAVAAMSAVAGVDPTTDEQE
jgi:hypothetical protein